MDYAARAAIVRHASWAAFLADPARREGRLVLFTTQAKTTLDSFAFVGGETLLFGRESAGAPAVVHQAAQARVRVPLAAGARSLNVAAAAGIALFEGLRQTGGLPQA